MIVHGKECCLKVNIKTSTLIQKQCFSKKLKLFDLHDNIKQSRNNEKT